MTRPRRPALSPLDGTRPPEYAIEAWVSPQLKDRFLLSERDSDSRGGEATGLRRRSGQPPTVTFDATHSAEAFGVVGQVIG
jgi:hypothetical protein